MIVSFIVAWLVQIKRCIGNWTSCFASSFQFETETEGAKLRQNVLAEGSVGSGGTPSGITSILSGQEEMFAFQRAVSSDLFSLSLSCLLLQ